MAKIFMGLYITKELKDILFEEAKNKGLSLSSYINMILLERNK